MEVSGQLNGPATIYLGEKPLALTGLEARWTPELVWMWWREKSLSHPVTSLAYLSWFISGSSVHLTLKLDHVKYILKVCSGYDCPVLFYRYDCRKCYIYCAIYKGI